MQTLRDIQTGILVLIGVLCLTAIIRAQTPSETKHAAKMVDTWNEAVATIDPETQNWLELQKSFKRNPPGRVLLTPDVRAEQKRRRLRLIAEIIAAHELRIKRLRELATLEETTPPNEPHD